MDCLVAYDIRTGDADGERTLARVAAICERYGVRVQYSVFEVRVTATTFERLRGELLDVLRAKDRVAVYRFPGRLADSRLDISGAVDRELDDPWII